MQISSHFRHVFCSRCFWNNLYFLRTAYFIFQQHLKHPIATAIVTAKLSCPFLQMVLHRTQNISNANLEITWGLKVLKSKPEQRINHPLKKFITMKWLQVPEAGRSYKVKTVLLDYSRRSLIYCIFSSFHYLRKMVVHL